MQLLVGVGMDFYSTAFPHNILPGPGFRAVSHGCFKCPAHLIVLDYTPNNRVEREETGHNSTEVLHFREWNHLYNIVYNYQSIRKSGSSFKKLLQIHFKPLF